MKSVDDIDIGSDNLSVDQIAQVKKLLIEFQDVFAKDSKCPGAIDCPPFDIELKDPDMKPICERVRPVKSQFMEELRELLIKMVESVLASPAPIDSLWGFPIVIVIKKSGKIRLCIDFRKLNKATVRYHTEIPLIADLVQRHHGMKIWSSFDNAHGYWVSRPPKELNNISCLLLLSGNLYCTEWLWDC